MALPTGPYFLYIPKRPESVLVIGEVLNPSTQRYAPKLSIKDYINLSGGLSDQANKNKIFIVLPNGEAEAYNRSLFSRNSSLILPGSTIVVQRNFRNQLELASVILPIVSSFATSAAAIAIISRDYDRN